MTEPLRMFTFAELCDEAEREAELRHQRRQWGRWRLYTETLELVFEERPGCSGYCIDLERMNTSAAVLDWIFQLHGKGWCSSEDIGDLIAALDDILSPQARLCSGAGGGGRRHGSRINATAVLRARYGAPVKTRESRQ